MPLVVGINGAQGAGKSTLAQSLQTQLADPHQLRAVIFSLDDLYLPRAERERLARQLHPLLLTRGVPGTHDVELGVRMLEGLKSLQRGAVLHCPRFIKAVDDRAPESEWGTVEGPVDVILFEGWCVGTPPQTEDELREPVNELETREDPDGRWRRYVNDRLATVYPRLFGQIARLVFLKVPDFQSVFRWRLQQEADNVKAVTSGAVRGMHPEELRRFIQHYERLMRHALYTLPERADVVLELGPEHEITGMSFR